MKRFLAKGLSLAAVVTILGMTSTAQAAPRQSVVFFEESFRELVAENPGEEFYRHAWAELSGESSYLRVRAQPGTGNEEIGFLRQYDEVYVMRKAVNAEGTWYLVQATKTGDYGWVSAGYMSLFPPNYYPDYHCGH